MLICMSVDIYAYRARNTIRFSFGNRVIRVRMYDSNMYIVHSYLLHPFSSE